MEKPEESDLGNATIRFSYNPRELSFPNVPSKGSDYTFNLDSSGHYLYSVTKPEPGKISVNIYFKRGVPQIITNKYYDLVSIRFVKRIEKENLKLNTYTVEIFSPNMQKPWQLKNFSLGFHKNISSGSLQ